MSEPEVASDAPEGALGEAGYEGEPGTGLASGPSASSSSTTSEAINLTTLDKIKRFFFSKEEWEAYLLERLEEEKRRQGGDIEHDVVCNLEEGPNDSTEKKTVISWIKTVFPSQDDANSFLKSQLDKLQEVKGNVSDLVTQSSSETAPEEAGTAE